MPYPRRNRHRPKWAVLLIVVVVCLILGVIVVRPRAGSLWQPSPQPSTTSSGTLSNTAVPVVETKPVLNDLIKTACSFAAEYWSSSPDDSPTAIKKRAAAYVLDPASFNWQSLFGVNLQTVKARCVPDMTTVEPDDDDPSRFVVSMAVERVTTNARTGVAFPPDLGSRSWVVYYVKSGGQWKAVAEEDRTMVNVPTTSR